MQFGDEHDECGLVPMRSVKKEFAESLTVQRRGRGGAVVEFMQHAPDRLGAACFAVGLELVAIDLVAMSSV